MSFPFIQWSITRSRRYMRLREYLLSRIQWRGTRASIQAALQTILGTAAPHPRSVVPTVVEILRCYPISAASLLYRRVVTRIKACQAS